MKQQSAASRTASAVKNKYSGLRAAGRIANAGTSGEQGASQGSTPKNAGLMVSTRIGMIGSLSGDGGAEIGQTGSKSKEVVRATGGDDEEKVGTVAMETGHTAIEMSATKDAVATADNKESVSSNKDEHKSIVKEKEADTNDAKSVDTDISDSDTEVMDEVKDNKVKDKEVMNNEVKDNKANDNEVKDNKGKDDEVKDNKINEVKENEVKDNKVKANEVKDNKVKDNDPNLKMTTSTSPARAVFVPPDNVAKIDVTKEMTLKSGGATIAGVSVSRGDPGLLSKIQDKVQKLNEAAIEGEEEDKMETEDANSEQKGG